MPYQQIYDTTDTRKRELKIEKEKEKEKENRKRRSNKRNPTYQERLKSIVFIHVNYQSVKTDVCMTIHEESEAATISILQI